MQVKRVTMTSKETSEYIGVSYWKLLEMTKKGEIPYIRINGKRLLFRQDSIDHWLTNHEEANLQ